MINIERQIEHWRQGSHEEWLVAQELIANKRVRQGLFWAHITLEKILKALLCKQTQDLAPRIHNLVRLAELARVPLTQEQVKFLTKVNNYNILGRYPEHDLPIPNFSEALAVMQQVGEMFAWLNGML